MDFKLGHYLLSEDDIAEWNAAIAEYEVKNPE